MLNVQLRTGSPELLLKKLAQTLDGTLHTEQGETKMRFEGASGNGIIQYAEFDRGVTLLEFDLEFKEEFHLEFALKTPPPLEFIFISEGEIGFRENGHAEVLTLHRYQNVILSPKYDAKKTYIFPPGERIRMNLIQIEKKRYLRKKHNRLRFIHQEMRSVFQDIESVQSFRHAGNYNLKIADEVRHLKDKLPGITSGSLSTEGRLYLILAMQLMEFHRFEEDDFLPESISQSDIRKIHQLSDYIAAHVSEPLTIAELSNVSGLSPKKLQLGFKVLFSKSVNAFVRAHKLEIARDLLHNSDKSISEVVYEIGFKSRSYFSRIFSERYGLLPTEYRRQLKRTP